MSRFTPQRAAQSISELNRFLYFRISGVSEVISWPPVGATLTEGICEDWRFIWSFGRFGTEKTTTLFNEILGITKTHNGIKTRGKSPF